MPVKSLGTPHITGSTLDELRMSVQFWIQQLYNHVDMLMGARGEPKLLADVNANNHNIVNLPDPTTPTDTTDAANSMSAVPRKFATPLVRQPDGSFAWDCRSIPMINDTYAVDPTGVPSLQQVQELINEKLTATLPSGVILLWAGSVASIPPGWVLCDGTNGTPDLRGRFIPGAGGAYAVNITGGADTLNLAHVHSADGTLAAAAESAHTHTDGTYTTGTPSATTTVDNDLTLSTVAVASSTHTHDVTGASGAGSAHTHDVTGDTNSQLSTTTDNRPAFFALAYIMKS